jgi:hypothetical protein
VEDDLHPLVPAAGNDVTDASRPPGRQRVSTAGAGMQLPQRKRAILHNSTQDDEAVLARDSNAVLTTFYPEQRKIGAMLSRADGGSSVLCYVLQTICVGGGLFSMLTTGQALAETAGMPAPNILAHVAGGLFGLGCASLALVISSARDALRPGGALEQLKVGEVMIGEDDWKAVSRWRVGVGVFTALGALVGLMCIISGAMSSIMLPPNTPTLMRIQFVLIGMLLTTSHVFMDIGWWTSMYTASCICRDEVIETIHAVRDVAPTSKEWDEAVAQPALGLTMKMKLLSDGWSGGLIGMTGSCWLWALTWFIGFINDPWNEGMDAAMGITLGTWSTSCIVIAAFFTPLPFLLAKDIANTSAWCNILMEELNDSRANCGQESHLKIQWVETVLKQQVSFACVVSVAFDSSLQQPHAYYLRGCDLLERKPRTWNEGGGNRDRKEDASQGWRRARECAHDPDYRTTRTER